MMKILKTYSSMIAVFLLAGTVFSSCKDFLEPKAKSEFVPKDATSLNELLLGEAYPLYSTSRLCVFHNLMDDDVSAAPYQEATVTGYDPNLYLAAYAWQPTLYAIMKEAGIAEQSSDIYATYYGLILGANAVIDYIDTVNDTQENINYVLAQAYALRGFYYFKLVNLFGAPYTKDPSALGVPLKLNSGVEEENLSRNTVAECYAQIEKDLLQAEQLYHTLPEARQWDSNYRTSLPMVQLLLSRMYLYMGEWKKASDYAYEVMQNKNFKLLDLNRINTSDENGRPAYHTYNSYSGSSEVIWPYGSTTNVSGWLADNGQNEQGEKVHAYFQASDDLMASFDETEGDLRKERYVTRSWYYTVDGEGNKIYMPQAFGKIAMSSGSNWYVPTSGSMVFGYSFRLSEAYLNYAEAEAMRYQQGESDIHRINALAVLNELRKCRIESELYAEVNKTDANSLLAFVKNERRRELCFEDFRWFDLRRWGMDPIRHVWHPNAQATVTYTLEKDDPQYTLPIPNIALEKNTSLKQNPLRDGIRIGTTTNN